MRQGNQTYLYLNKIHSPEDLKALPSSAMPPLAEEIRAELASLSESIGVASSSHLYLAYRLFDILTVQDVTLAAMIDFTKQTPLSRGSALYTDETGELRDGLEELFRLRVGSRAPAIDSVQEMHPDGGDYRAVHRPVRPIPDSNEAFESVWRVYRENQNIF